MPELVATTERWPIAGEFTISRGSKSVAEVVVVRLTEGDWEGRGECVPYPRYGESPESVMDAIEANREAVEGGIGRHELRSLMPAGAARNAVDCALWDLESKQRGARAWELADRPAPEPAVCAYTLSLGTPEEMRRAAAENAHRPLLKLKLGGGEDVARVEAVRQGAPEARIIVDANEAWTVDDYRATVPRLADLGVAMIEQPFPEGEDGVLADLERPVPVCADESLHAMDGLEAALGRYDMVNIKLDKAGGLTEGLELATATRAAGVRYMVGCMVGTSLAMAPATVIMGEAAYVDLDGPLLLAEDREPGLRYEDGRVHPPERRLWG